MQLIRLYSNLRGRICFTPLRDADYVRFRIELKMITIAHISDLKNIKYMKETIERKHYFWSHNVTSVEEFFPTLRFFHQLYVYTEPV